MIPLKVDLAMMAIITQEIQVLILLPILVDGTQLFSRLDMNKRLRGKPLTVMAMI